MLSDFCWIICLVKWRKYVNVCPRMELDGVVFFYEVDIL